MNSFNLKKINKREKISAILGGAIGLSGLGLLIASNHIDVEQAQTLYESIKGIGAINSFTGVFTLEGAGLYYVARDSDKIVYDQLSKEYNSK